MNTPLTAHLHSDKKTATTFHLVHRAQNDPLIHDENASSMVFAEVAPSNIKRSDDLYGPAGSSRASVASHHSYASQYSAASGRAKIKHRGDLESEYEGKVRRNEGEAANYGIYYDDTEYDYMQHMKDLGQGGGESYFLEAPSAKKGKGKQMDLADMLRLSSLDDGRSEAGLSMASTVSRSATELFGQDMAPSEFVRKTTYQDQQNIPDAIAGFQPDMDPRLREVLEALEDEAYVDDEDDIFEALAADAVEVDQREWEASGYLMDEFGDGEGEGWESDASDDTIRAGEGGGVRLNLEESKEKENVAPTDPNSLPAPDAAPAPVSEGDDAWMDEFKKFKQDVKASKRPEDKRREYQQSIMTGASALTAGGRHKKRKGALTNPSAYSMSSSALHRTDALSLLDERFDKIEEEYANDDYFPDDASMISGMSKMSGLSKMSGMSGLSSMSEAPEMRADFDNILDDFLGTHTMAGKRRVKKGKQQSGLEQLDEVRQGLGGARISARVRAKNSALAFGA